jgi:methionyl-tRNA synthetase
MPEPCYLTTPIYYVNDRPHIGHCYTTVVADVASRFQRLLGRDTFLLTGTDEHADKVVTSAAAHGKTPQEWADLNAAEFQRAFALMGVASDDFIRTTEPRHKDKVPAYIRALIQKGDIYKGEYTGWYDEGQEEYLTETAAKDANFHSPINKKPLVRRTEPCYFFRLSAYQERLRGLIERDEFRIAPESRKNEVLGRLRPPAVLNDIPVSRPVTSDPATQWGVRVPGDDAHRVYVWIDALFNYLTVVDTPERRKYWPPAVHLIGKDILWFHAVIWPALLLGLRESGGGYDWVRLPRCVFGHGWWIAEGEKMSKSLGNFIDLEKLRGYAARYGLDALRWYLVTQGPLSGADADFNHAKFVEVYNAELANGIGNCASRVGNMVEKYFGGVLPAPGEGPSPAAAVADAVAGLAALCDAVECQHALARGVAIVRAVDGYINATQPFKIAKTVEQNPGAKAQLGTILYHCAEAIRIASILLSPALIEKMPLLWRTWGCAPPTGAGLVDLCAFGGPHALKPGQRIAKGEILYMRADPADAPPAPVTA